VAPSPDSFNNRLSVGNTAHAIIPLPRFIGLFYRPVIPTVMLNLLDRRARRVAR